MNITALDEEVAALEATLPDSIGVERLNILTPLAWHLRQRATRRALTLADEADRLTQHDTLDVAKFEYQDLLRLVTADVRWLVESRARHQVALRGQGIRVVEEQAQVPVPTVQS